MMLSIRWGLEEDGCLGVNVNESLMREDVLGKKNFLPDARKVVSIPQGRYLSLLNARCKVETLKMLMTCRY